MLDLKHSTSNLSPASVSDSEPVRRLIVLVPRFDFNLPAFAQRVLGLANATGSNILFLSLFNEAGEESTLRRELATLSAIIKDDKVSVETEILFGKDWVQAVKSRLQAVDMVVCFAEHRIDSSNKPLSQVLQSQVNAQIYILSGLVSQPHSNRLSEIIAWAGSIAIILGLFFLQIKIIDFTKDWARTLLLLISLPVEIWAIWAWNNLFG